MVTKHQPEIGPAVDETATPLHPTTEASSNALIAVESSSARASLVELFSRLKVVKVVLVDDKLKQQLDAGVVFSVLSIHPEAATGLKDYFDDLNLDLQNEALLEQVSARLAELDAEKLQLLQPAIELAAPDVFEREVFSQLQAILPEGVETEFLTPTEWHQKRPELVAECQDERRTLFLFDQELDVGQGLPFAKGSDIIRDMAETDGSGFGTRWFCGMLSHTLQKGGEVTAWRALAKEENIGLRLFMPIAKANLNDSPAFYQAVYRALINIYCEGMKALAKEAFEEALTRALNSFADLDPIDFEHSVVKSSEVEGVSELETIIRVYGIIQRDHVKAQILKEAKLVEFSGHALAVKGVADIARTLPPGSRERLLKLRQTELYEDDGLVNGYNDPLRNGDVFEIGEGQGVKLWVLIAQPCDLMVRDGGERAREDNFKVAVLAPIRTRPFGDEVSSKHGLSFVLDHFDHEGAQSAVVDFVEATPANLRILDLAVFSKTGRCEIGPVAALDPNMRLPARVWTDRAKVLAEYFGKVTVQIEGARAKHKDEAAKLISDAVLPRVSATKKLARHGTYEGGKFVYAIRRTGRIRDPLAASLLSAFSRYLSRDAYEHDFSRETKIQAATV